MIVKTFPGVYDPAALPLAAEYGPVERPQVVLAPAPLYHTNGFASVLNLVGGDTVVLMERFDAALVLDLIERHRVSTFTATSTMLQRIAAVDGIDSRDLSSIRTVLQGAAVTAPSLVHRWLELVGPERFLMDYGMTEGLGLSLIRGDEWLAHPGSVGRGVRDTEIRVLGPDGAEMPAGEVGEIFLRSPAGQGYTYLGAVADLPITADGFATAGDLGSLDGDGFLSIADRRVDMIITGGANVYPAEVENALGDHPAVGDVVVIGLADPEWGRRVHAIVAPADASAPPAPADIVAFAKERLAPYKVPKTVEVVERIPRSEATKVSRRALIDERGG
ncbi:MAG: AMP-binding protein [Acidimicrobiales bacterium]